MNTGMPRCARGVEVDLVGADAEAAHRDQPVGGLEHLARVSWVRERMPSIARLEAPAQRLAIQRLGQAARRWRSRGREQPTALIVDPFEQQQADLVLGQR